MFSGCLAAAVPVQAAHSGNEGGGGDRTESDRINMCILIISSLFSRLDCFNTGNRHINPGQSKGQLQILLSGKTV